MKDVRTETALGTFGMLTATARPDVDGAGWFVTVAAIYQHAHVGGTEFCYTDDDPLGSYGGNPLRKGRVKDIDFKWDWGIKAGIGYYFEHDNWEIYLNYLWLSTSGSRNISAGLNSSIIPLKGVSSILNNCGDFSENSFVFSTVANSQFEADFNIINLELGRDYYISPKLSLRPHFGLQNTWIDLEQVVRYSGGEVPTFAGNPAGIGIHTVQVKDDSDFWGIGPRVGVNTKWYLRSGFNFFGDISGALLASRFDVDHREKFSLCPDLKKVHLDANLHKIVPTGQIAMGLDYEFCFNDNKNFALFRLGFDTQYFWRVIPKLLQELDFRLRQKSNS